MTLALAAVFSIPATVTAQVWAESVPASVPEDSVAVVAGPRYAAGSLRRFLLGGGYRDLWQTPIEVPVLRPDTFDGGLTVLQRGESPQTLSLRFANPEGLQWVFRSVDKEQAEGLPPALQNTIIEFIAQDLVASKHPGGAMVIAPLLEAAGVLHATPRLAVMADDPVIVEHRDTFAGMLGMMEERPDEVENSRGFRGYERIIGTERLLERLEESPVDRVDARAYLRARLMDVLVGDWDRHPDQWRWAEEERDGTRYWLPIPRDRDNAFSHVDGAVGLIARLLRPTVFVFEEEYHNLYGMIHNAQVLDRRILAELTRQDWDSTALDIQRRLTDGVIDSAVARLPAEWRPLEAGPLARKLRARRDALRAAAGILYRTMNTEVEVYGTDEEDLADIERLPDGSVRVRLTVPQRGDRPYFDRLFTATDTREVRVHLRGGADQAIVRGEGGDINIRVLGGGNDDLLEDYSRTHGGVVTAFYDDRGDNRIQRTARTVVDRRTYDAPETGFAMEGNAPPVRDWGSQRIGFYPAVGWVADIGPIAGGGPVWVRYGFRRAPFASRIALTMLTAPLAGRFGVELSGRFIRTGGDAETLFSARATQLGVTSFFGYGNETEPPATSSLRRVLASELIGSLDLRVRVSNSASFTVGPTVQFIDPEPRPGSPALGIRGARSFGVAGLRVSGGFDARDSKMIPSSGVRFEAGAETYPATWGDAPEPFGRAEIVGSGYLPLPGRIDPVLALRLGGQRVFGEAPLQYAAFVGGSNLRGHSTHRFAGDASAYGNLELRTNLGRANLILLTGDLGIIARADAGRVFVDGEDSNRWHTAVGGGLWFGSLERSLAVHMLYAYGERHTLNVGLGLPF